MLRRLLVLPFCACLLVLTAPAGALTNVEPARNDHRWHDDKPGLLEAEHAEHRAIVDRLWSDALRAVWDTAVAELERQAAEEARARRQSSSSSRMATGGGSYAGNPTGSINGYPCGGDLPPCGVLRRESNGSPTAENPSSSASGLWQFIDSTWNGFGGCAHASDCPPEVQNEKARQTWAGGDGRSHWAETLP